MQNMGGIFGILGVGCGIYIFYALYKLKTNGDITSSILLPKDVNPKSCKDKEGYIKAVTPKMAILGASTILYGLMDLCESFVMSTGYFFWIVLVLVLAVLVWFSVTISRLNKTYF